MSIHYQLSLQPNLRQYEVALNVVPNTTILQVSLPVWIPGSYMIREFSRNIISLSARQNEQVVACLQISKNQWQLNGLLPNQELRISYTVYANEVGIRSAFIGYNRAYFNPTSVCLQVQGYEQQPHSISISQLPEGWQVACGLEQSQPHYFNASDYDHLADSPFELGWLQRYQFSLAGVEHFVVLSGSILDFDQERFLSDIQKICAAQLELFGGVAPYPHYTFILNLAGEVFTGLEHRNSTLLMAPCTALPNRQGSNNEDYTNLLGLISHEFFHTWNVKRIKPQAFIPYDFNNENYTRLLWWFEGVTSYYDDLILHRAGLINREQYLGYVINNINNVYKFAGASVQSLANSSLTSWIKYYRPDENSPNTVVSYYIKGALVAMCLDLAIRSQSQYSLDDVLRLLFKRWQQDGRGVAEDEIADLIKQATGVDLSQLIYLATETTETLPLKSLLAKFGLKLTSYMGQNYQDQAKFNQIPPPKLVLDLGLKLEQQNLGYLVKNVYANTPAAAAGLAAGDWLIALDDMRLTNLEKQLAFYAEGSLVKLTLLRHERLINLSLKLAKAQVYMQTLTLHDEKLVQQWLG